MDYICWTDDLKLIVNGELVGHVEIAGNKFRAVIFEIDSTLYTSHWILDRAKMVVEIANGVKRVKPRYKRVMSSTGVVHVEESYLKNIYYREAVETDRPFSYTGCGRTVKLGRRDGARRLPRKETVTCKLCLENEERYKDDYHLRLKYNGQRGTAYNKHIEGEDSFNRIGARCA